MALYEPIKGHEDDEEHGMPDSVIINNSMNDQDVEMAVRISKLRSSAPPNGAVSVATAYTHPPEPTSLPASKLRHHQQRLVSLDVFRGLTVVVMSLLPPSLSLSFGSFRFVSFHYPSVVPLLWFNSINKLLAANMTPLF